MQIKQGMEEEYAKYREINSGDPYSRGVISFEDRWVDLMEAELAKGKTVAECAEETSDAADTEGITGFMYGCAVTGLSKFWEHGEELRRWHNKEYDYQGSGVVNPAVIIIGDK